MDEVNNPAPEGTSEEQTTSDTPAEGASETSEESAE